MRITVTARHIALGVRGIDWLCPVARAVRDECPNDLVSVGYERVTIVTPGDHRRIYALPHDVQALIRQFDDQGFMQPFAFEAEPL